MNTDKTYAERIASEYAPKETSKVTALKKLDGRAKRGANLFAYSFGIAAALIFGVGMCFALKTLGDGTLPFMIAGVALGVAGLVGMSVNYFFYKKLIARGKIKYGADILRLAREISEENK